MPALDVSLIQAENIHTDTISRPGMLGSVIAPSDKTFNVIFEDSPRMVGDETG